MMNKKLLGNTGIAISPLGLGTVKFGRNEGVKYPSSFNIPSESDLDGLLHLALDLGINLLDTAPAYGTSEERLGRLLKGRRDQWIIAGKAGEEFENGQSRHDFSPAHFEVSLARSLKRLNTDYLDILLIHSNGVEGENFSDDLIQTLQDFKKRGLVRAIGASTKTVQGGLRAVKYLDIVMATYNPIHTDEKPVLDAALENGKSVLLKKVLSSGHATSPSEALKFAFDHPAVTSAIIGTINPDHLRANVENFLSLR